MRTLCYCRTSSAIQADRNDADAQRAAIVHWLKGAGIDPETGAEWFVDSGVSGSTMQRPEWERMLASIKGEPTTIVVYDITRAGRTLLGLLEWVNAMIAAKVRVVFIKDNLDINTPMGRMMLQIMGAIAEWERQNIAERIRGGVRAAKAKTGTWGGSRLPHGAKGGPKFTPEQIEAMRADEASGMSRADIARKHGVSWGTIRAKLGKRQVPTAADSAASS